MSESCIQRLAQALCAAELPAQSVWRLEGTQDKIRVPSEWALDLNGLEDAPSEAAQVIAVDALTPTLLRKLSQQPPLLLVITGTQLDPSMRTKLRETCPDLKILGPGAGLWVDPKGQGARLAVDASQLWSPRAIHEPARLQIAPTPDWIFPGLCLLKEQGQVIQGWVHTPELGPEWRKLLEGPVPALLSACCPNPPEIQAKPWDPGLEAIALAHDLAAPIGLDFPGTQEAFAWLAQSQQSPEPSPSFATWLPERWDTLFRHCAKAHGAAEPELPGPKSWLRNMPPMVAVPVAQAKANLERWQQHSDDACHLGLDSPPLEPQDAGRSLEVLQAASEQLTDHESKVVLKGWDFEVTRQAIGKSTSAALSYAQKLGYPVALKAISPQMRHKSKCNCVALDVVNASSLKRHYQKINDLAIEAVGEDQLDGVLVSEMVPVGLDVQIRALKGASGQWSVVARCQQGSRKDDASPPAWSMVSSHPSWPLRFASRVIPTHHPHRRSVCEALAIELQKLTWPLEELGDRLFCIELDPLRIFVDDARPPTVLDAYIEQDAHIHGV